MDRRRSTAAGPGPARRDRHHPSHGSSAHPSLPRYERRPARSNDLGRLCDRAKLSIALPQFRPGMRLSRRICLLREIPANDLHHVIATRRALRRGRFPGQALPWGPFRGRRGFGNLRRVRATGCYQHRYATRPVGKEFCPMLVACIKNNHTLVKCNLRRGDEGEHAVCCDQDA